jgi:hypothetical protein
MEKELKVEPLPSALGSAASLDSAGAAIAVDRIRAAIRGRRDKRITLSRQCQTVEKCFVVAVTKKYLPHVVAAGQNARFGSDQRLFSIRARA